MFNKHHLTAVALSLALHALAWWGVLLTDWPDRKPAEQETVELPVILLEALPPKVPEELEPPPLPSSVRRPEPMNVPADQPSPPTVDFAPTATSMDYQEAPRAPTAEDWALAGSYKLRNSKRYRHTWGQQIRSMMGTAYAGPDQGAVRFRIEIAPDGRMVRLETLWSTSPVAERLARQAVANLPPLPPTPTGEPLVFEKTIAFHPYAVDDQPVYKDDCLPEQPAFRNPYAWDGRSPQGAAVQPTTSAMDPVAYEECLRQLPQETIEAESASDQRQLRQWRSSVQGTR